MTIGELDLLAIIARSTGRRDAREAARDLIAEVRRLRAALADSCAREREACAKLAEGGSFVHADAPDARFGRAVAAAIRRRQ